MMTRKLILASTSPFRRQLMRNAGLVFTSEESGVDERRIESDLGIVDPVAISIALAKAKAEASSRRNPSAIVIGCDQTLSLDGEVLHKSASIADAQRVLMRLRGKTHQLSSAIAIAIDGQIQWQHVGIAKMTVRPFTEAFLQHYVAAVDETVLRSVGGYQLEGLGVQLFEAVDGDYFTVLGLPLLPLLEELRRTGIIHA